MFPMTDLDLDEEAAHYMPDDRLESWEEYDEKVLVSSHAKPPNPQLNLSNFKTQLKIS